jgi:hypothetical protein
LRAKAVEFLDNILDPSLKRMIIPIIERISSKVQISGSLGTSDMAPSSEDETLDMILDEDDIWIKVCALFYMAMSGIFKPAWKIKRFTTDPDPMTRETAEYALSKFEA